jgi:hypothetical protein
MAAVARICVNCGEEFVALRPHKLTCGDRCKKAEQRKKHGWPNGFKVAERVLVERVAANQEDPLEALARITDAWSRTAA